MSWRRAGVRAPLAVAGPLLGRRGCSRRWSAALLVAIAGTTACASWPQEPDLLLLGADALRSGALGEHGPHGVGCAQLRCQVGVHDGVDLQLCWPVDEATAPAAGGPFAGAVIVPGALVAPHRYDWLVTHLVSRGHVVVTPAFPLDLALLEPERVVVGADLLRDAAAAAGGDRGAVDGLVRVDGGIAVVGHSLGAVVATRAWLADADLGPLVLLGGYPDAADPVRDRAGDAVLSLTGDQDGYATVAEVRAGWERFAAPRVLGVVAGLHHFAWADGATAWELASDRPPQRPLPELRRDALRLLDAFVGTYLHSDAGAWAALSGGAFPRVEVQR